MKLNEIKGVEKLENITLYIRPKLIISYYFGFYITFRIQKWERKKLALISEMQYNMDK